MTRLLLGEDLSLYEDGTVPSLGTPDAVAPTKAEVPYHDARFVGHALTVAGDGTLTWVLNEHVPEVDATYAGAALVINAQGSAEWRQINAITNNEVLTSDGVGEGNIFYGLDLALTPQRGDLHIVTRRREGEIPPSAPSAAPVLATPIVTGSSVAISWTAVANATSYEVAVDDVVVRSTTSLTDTLTFAENETHDVKVRGVNSAGSGSFSNEETAVIGNQPPPPINNMGLLAMDGFQFQVGWAYELPVDFDHFDVTTSPVTSIDHDDGTWYATISGAPYATDVTVTVTVVDDLGGVSDPFSSIIRTPPEPPPAAPVAVTNVHTTRIGYSSVDLAWDATVDADTYEWSPDGTNWTSVGATLAANITGLAEATTFYTYRVRAVNEGGASSPTWATFTTEPRIAGYTSAYSVRTFGFDTGEDWSLAGVSHVRSGILTTVDSWAASHWQKAVDKQKGTNAASSISPGGPGRWIEFSTSILMDDIEQIVCYWQWFGSMSLTITNDLGVETTIGGAVATHAPDYNTGLDANWMTTMTPTYAAGTRITKWRVTYFTVGSPAHTGDGLFLLQEMRVRLRQIVQAEEILNDP